MRSAVLGAGMRRRLARSVQRLGLPPVTGADPVDAAELAGLPAAAQRWLYRAGVIGNPRDTWVSAHWTGRFRLRPGQRWLPFEAWQHTSRAPVTRVYRMRVDVGGVLPVFGSDVYADGRGRMRARLLGVFPVADGSGPAFDVGELVTWLDDAVLLAPSMLLGTAPPGSITWSEPRADGPGDPGAFDVSLTDGGRTVTARVTVDESGRVHDVTTEDRWCALPGGPVRARWTTRVDGWTTVAGRPVPLYARAFWDLPGGRWTYASIRLRPHDLRRSSAPLPGVPSAALPGTPAPPGSPALPGTPAPPDTFAAPGDRP